MNRLYLPEKALVVALDHAQTLGVVPGLEDPGRVLDTGIEAGADGIMTSYASSKNTANASLDACQPFYGSMADPLFSAKIG